jgi:hypothetical protein
VYFPSSNADQMPAIGCDILNLIEGFVINATFEM